MSDYILHNGELYHHGVKGMKWGVRNARKRERVALRRASKALTESRKEEFLEEARKAREEAKRLSDGDTTALSNKSDDAKRISELRKKDIDELSNKELNDLNNRLEAERKYKNFTKTKSKGKQAIETFVSTASTLNSVVNAYDTYTRLGARAYNTYNNRRTTANNRRNRTP